MNLVVLAFSLWVPTAVLAAGPVPAYEWATSGLLQHEGRVLPNTGHRGAEAVPAPQVLTASGVALDEDGSHTHQRVVWDEQVVDPLGHHEAVTLAFTRPTERQSFLVLSALAALPNTDHVLTVWVKRKGDTTGKFILGSSSDAVGAKTVFEAPPEWTEISVNFRSGEAGGGPRFATRPGVHFPLRSFNLCADAPRGWGGGNSA